VKRIKQVKAGDFTFETIDVGMMLSEVIARYSPVPDRSVRISYTPVPGCYVLANNLLAHVFSNIVENAIKHSSGPLVVNVSLTRVGENANAYYRVAIEDNGPGMPDEQKKQVFGEWVRDKAGTRRIGLGLQLVKTLVEAFHGKVWAEDRVSGDYHKGCRFVVLLPALEK
jgi:signal transduction histidine kinase